MKNNHSLLIWITCHSSNPCMLSEFNFLTAITVPLPLFDTFSSSQPLKTFPKPPSPRTVSGLKFFVAAFSSEKVKILKLGWGKIWPLGKASSLPPLAAENWLFLEKLLPREDVVLVVVWDTPAAITPLIITSREKKHKTKLQFKSYTKLN